MMEYQNLEHWNDGRLEWWVKITMESFYLIIPVFQHSTIPTFGFQYSIIPGSLLLFSDCRLIQLKGLMEGSDGQFSVSGVDDTGDFDL